MTPLAFIASRLGHVVKSPSGLGGECVDLANLYLLAVRRQAEVQANAVDWLQVSIPGMSYVSNTPANYPSLGDLVVWEEFGGNGIGPNGHIAIAVAADVIALGSCDQNWPDGAPVRLVMHDYGGVVGWFHAG